MALPQPAPNRRSAHPPAISRVVDGYQTQAWTELVLRNIARATNLLLPSTRFVIVGSGPIAESLAQRLTTFGAHVAVVSTDPVELVELRDRMSVRARSIVGAQFIPADSDVVIATGEHHPVVTPIAVSPGSERPVVIADAAFPADPRSVDRALFGKRDDQVAGRRPVQRPGARPVLVLAPAPAEEFDNAVAGIRGRFAALSAAHGPGGADVELAKALLS